MRKGRPLGWAGPVIRPPAGEVFERVESRLLYGGSTARKQLDTFRVGVVTYDIVAGGREACGRHSAEMPEPRDADPHLAAPASCRTRSSIRATVRSLNWLCRSTIEMLSTPDGA